MCLAVIDKFRYNVPLDPNARSKKDDVKDFRRLNKVVLREGATNAATNRALRSKHDMRLQPKNTQRSSIVSTSLPNASMTFGRANRPQTPVNGIINNMYGEQGSEQLQERYTMWKQQVSGKQIFGRGLVGVAPCQDMDGHCFERLLGNKDCLETPSMQWHLACHFSV